MIQLFAVMAQALSSASQTASGMALATIYCDKNPLMSYLVRMVEAVSARCGSMMTLVPLSIVILDRVDTHSSIYRCFHSLGLSCIYR